ncbi:MAG: hypothetical protein WBX20_13045 [Terrimicrobiaceae bacterium]
MSLDILVKLEPELLRGFLTLRVGYLILLLTTEVSAEFSLRQDEAYEKLAGFSPSEVQSRLIAVLRDYAQVARRLESQEALCLRPGVEVEWHAAGGETAQPSPTPPDGWLDQQRQRRPPTASGHREAKIASLLNVAFAELYRGYDR